MATRRRLPVYGLSVKAKWGQVDTKLIWMTYEMTGSRTDFLWSWKGPQSKSPAPFSPCLQDKGWWTLWKKLPRIEIFGDGTYCCVSDTAIYQQIHLPWIIQNHLWVHCFFTIQMEIAGTWFQNQDCTGAALCCLIHPPFHLLKCRFYFNVRLISNWSCNGNDRGQKLGSPLST